MVVERESSKKEKRGIWKYSPAFEIGSKYPENPAK